MIGQLKITFNDGTVNEYPSGITLLELSKYYQPKFLNRIIGAKINNVYHRLDEKIMNNCVVNFIDHNDIDGYSLYKSGLKFVLYVAVKEEFGANADINFYNSIDKGMYIKVSNGFEANEANLDLLTRKMQEIVSMDFPISMQYVKNRDVINYYNSVNQPEKADNAGTSTNVTLTIYKLKSYFNYFYTSMPSSTGVLTKFELTYVDKEHFVLRYPTPSSKGKIPEYTNYEKTLKSFEEYRSWLKMVQVPYLSDLNKIVSASQIREFISQNYIISENYFYETAKEVYNQNQKSKVKIVFIAGPSSSGKTTSSKKLAMHLKTFGLKPFAMSCDDFYKEREETPKFADGTYDFESIDAIDLTLLAKTINKLINFEEVQIPSFNFYTGKKEFKDNPVKLSKDSVIVFEGLHCLNNQITSLINKENQYRIYISPFPGINIDRHNYISSVDLRLIRRMVRDNVFRGYNVEQTMALWQKVRNGEEHYVFPYQGEADRIINSSLVYEIGVLRVFVEPLLSSVPVTSDYYEEARRLLGFVRGFFSINPEYVSRDTILREFIGDSIFK